MRYLPQGVGLPMQEKEKKDDGRLNQLAIGAFIAFVSLTIVLITQLKINEFNIIITLLFIMLLVLISGFFGKTIYHILIGYSEKREYNKLAKFYFKDFKNLVIRFKEFTEGRDDNIHLVMRSIKNLSSPYGEGSKNPFSQINVIQPIFFQDRYNYYNERLNQFDGTKDSLVSLAKEFESILYMYDMLYTKDPINAIRTIGQDKVSKQYKESYNKARLKYIDFLNNYKNFAKIANEDLKEKEETFGLGGGILFRDFFDFPEEL